MKVLIVNSVCGIRSTGRICTDIAEKYIKEGHECRIAYGREVIPKQYEKISYRISSEKEVKINALKARILDNDGFNAKKATKKFVEWANDYNPDVLWLHNLHGYYINVDILFRWIKTRPNMEVKWTLHDCWAFTGHCTHFTYVNCEKWKKECCGCIQTKEYPKAIFYSRCKKNFLKKKSIFCGVKKMNIITPSEWLSDLVKKSFLKEYLIEVIYNDIDREVFKPTNNFFRANHCLENKKIVLGVSSVWNERKGLNDFNKLAEMLNDDYKIVIVGGTKKHVKKVSKKILCIERTNSKKELAQIYTAADLFVNPSKEETFGLTTLEALVCGTFPIVYQNTACEEVVHKYGGCAIPQNTNDLYEAVIHFLN